MADNVSYSDKTSLAYAAEQELVEAVEEKARAEYKIAKALAVLKFNNIWRYLMEGKKLVLWSHFLQSDPRYELREKYANSLIVQLSALPDEEDWVQIPSGRRREHVAAHPESKGEAKHSTLYRLKND